MLEPAAWRERREPVPEPALMTLYWLIVLSRPRVGTFRGLLPMCMH